MRVTPKEGTVMTRTTATPESIKTLVQQMVDERLAELGLLADNKSVEPEVTEPEVTVTAAEKAAQRVAHKTANREAAAWMREKGLTPSGQAWAAVKNGERNVTKLRKLNADVAKATPKVVTEEVVTEPAKKATAKKATAKKAPAKKAPAKRATKKAAPTEGADDTFTEETLAVIERLTAEGLSEEEIVLALGEARKAQQD
jgi:hypothetical protein